MTDKEKLKILTDTVEWYADYRNWAHRFEHSIVRATGTPYAFKDYGKRAKVVLKAMNEDRG